MEADTASSGGRGFRWYDVMSWWLRWRRGAPSPDWATIRWNEFTGAELKLSQFREATIVATSFARADLYRAVFDRALLCDVNFTNADLSNASFWGATMDDRTYGWLRKTAWWTAVGWDSDDFKKLLRPQSENQPDPQSPSVYPPSNAAEGRALRHALRTSDRFHTDYEVPITETRPGHVRPCRGAQHHGLDAGNLGNRGRGIDAKPRTLQFRGSFQRMRSTPRARRSASSTI